MGAYAENNNGYKQWALYTCTTNRYVRHILKKDIMSARVIFPLQKHSRFYLDLQGPSDSNEIPIVISNLNQLGPLNVISHYFAIVHWRALKEEDEELKAWTAIEGHECATHTSWAALEVSAWGSDQWEVCNTEAISGIFSPLEASGADRGS